MKEFMAALVCPEDVDVLHVGRDPVHVHGARFLVTGRQKSCSTQSWFLSVLICRTEVHPSPENCSLKESI